MYIEEEGDDSVVERLKCEADFLEIDSSSDRFEEEDNTDGWFWKDDGLDCDAIDM